MALIDEPHEILYRSVFSIDELVWDEEFYRPSPVVFKDRNNSGLSVVKRGKRSEKETISALKEKLILTQAVVKISVKSCVEAKTYPFDKPTRKDSYHAEIWNSKTEKFIESSKRYELAQKAEVVDIIENQN